MAVVALLLAVMRPVMAQDETSAEALAVAQPGERVALERDTIAQYGTQTRFEVAITWDASAGARPATYRPRAVRYVADCESGALTLVAVGLFDSGGQLVKSLILPPGAADAVTPAAGSRESRWMKEVCGK
jgi:hypothetical protein